MAAEKDRTVFVRITSEQDAALERAIRERRKKEPDRDAPSKADIIRELISQSYIPKARA